MQSNLENKASNNSEEIFVARSHEIKPPSKRSVWSIIGYTILVVIVLTLVLLVSLYFAATNSAKNYANLSYAQLKKIDSSLTELKTSNVLNNRNTSPIINKINASKQTQPTLQNVLFIGGLNGEYHKAQTLQQDIQAHYQNIETYANNMGQLLRFDDDMAATTAQDASIESAVQPGNSLTLRTAAGTYQSIGDKVSKSQVSKEMQKTKMSIAGSYNKMGNIYTVWAKDVEAGNTSTADTHKMLIEAEKVKITNQLTDAHFVLVYKSQYENLLKNQKTLETALNNI